MSKRNAVILSGILLYIIGVIISLSLSAVMMWGEMEARLYTQQSGDKHLKIACPLMIAPWESAAVSTVVTNTLRDQDTRPQVNAIISREQEARVVTQTLELGPLDSRSLQWTVDASDIVFERLILVNILQRPYRDLPSRQGACSIVVFSLFGWSGMGTLYAMVAAGVAASLVGVGLLYSQYRPLTDFSKKIAALNAVFLVLVLMGLVSALTRLWGLTLLLDSAALLVIAAGSIELFLSKR